MEKIKFGGLIRKKLFTSEKSNEQKGAKKFLKLFNGFFLGNLAGTGLFNLSKKRKKEGVLKIIHKSGLDSYNNMTAKEVLENLTNSIFPLPEYCTGFILEEDNGFYRLNVDYHYGYH